MRSKTQPHIISNFFLDGAKIIFGSLVIGVFLPNTTTPKFPFVTLIVGMAMTIVFLILAHTTEKADNENKENAAASQA